MRKSKYMSNVLYLESFIVPEYTEDVLEDDPLLGEVRVVPDLGLDGGHASVGGGELGVRWHLELRVNGEIMWLEKQVFRWLIVMEG